MTKPSCEKCKFTKSESFYGEGLDRRPEPEIRYECRRFPPSVGITTMGVYSEFPTVYAGQWCGEFKEKEEE